MTDQVPPYTDDDDPGFDTEWAGAYAEPSQPPPSKWVGYDHTESRVLSFGRYRGVAWDSIPLDYLKWAARNLYNEVVADQISAYLIHERCLPEDWREIEDEAQYGEDSGYTIWGDDVPF